MLRRLLLVASLTLTVALGSGCSQENIVDSALTLEQKVSRLERKSIRIDGHEIVYMEGGSGPAILMLHGITADSGNWTRFARHFSNNYHVIIPDLPGFGRSSRIADASYSVPKQTERVRALMQALGVRQFHLVGNSMGGYIGAYYAATHPDEVLTLGLFDAAGVDSPQKTEFMQQLFAGNNLMLPQDRDDFRRILKLVMEEPPFIPGYVLDVLGERAVEHKAFNARIFDELRREELNLAPLLPQVKAPTLLLWGGKDRIIDISSIQVFRQNLTRAKTSVVVMPEVGHIPMLERPGETARHYQSFLDS